MTTAAFENAAAINWHDRGKAPRGYSAGMAASYKLAVEALKRGDSWAVEAAQSLGPAFNDALAHYSKVGISDLDMLRKVWTLMWGLGMRESSGKYCEGRDRSATNTTSETAEAGLFQQSWNSRAGSSEITKLLTHYDGPGLVDVYRDGVSCSFRDLANYGKGDGAKFQATCKNQPDFATRCAAIGLRTIRKHWGPINRHEAEYRIEVERLLREIDGG